MQWRSILKLMPILATETESETNPEAARWSTVVLIFACYFIMPLGARSSSARIVALFWRNSAIPLYIFSPC